MLEPAQLVVLGASAFGEAASLLRDINASEGGPRYKVVALLDDNDGLHGTEIQGVPVAGGLDRWADYPGSSFVFLIGSHRSRIQRRSILQRLNIPRERFATLIHPTAVVFEGAQIGRGCLLYSGVVVFNDSVLEDFVLILPNSVVGAHCTVATSLPSRSVMAMSITSDLRATITTVPSAKSSAALTYSMRPPLAVPRLAIMAISWD